MDSTRVSPVRQDGQPTDRYTRLPDALIELLPSRMHQLVHLLLSYRWTEDAEIRPYVGTLARRLGVSKRTVQRWLAWLEEHGYIVVKARYRDQADDEHHGQTSNAYLPGPMLLPLLPRDADDGDGPSTQPRRDPMTPVADTKRQGNRNNRRTEKNGRYTPPSTGADFLETRYGLLRPRQ